MVKTRMSDGVLWISLNRPEQRNAINREMIDGLTQGLEMGLSDADCRCLVVTGSGGHFSGGRDLRNAPTASSLPEFLDRDVAWTQIFKLLGTASKPSVAVVEGYAVAGGFTLAMACDFVIAERGAKFGALEMRNHFPAAINTPILGKIASPRIGLEMAMTGALFDAERLYAAGLINHLADGSDGLEELAATFTASLAALDPDAVAMTKDLHRAAQNTPLTNALDMGKYANALLAASGRIGAAERQYRGDKS